MKLLAIQTKPIPSATAAELRSRAEARLRMRRKNQSKARASESKADAQRLPHELQVHQIELEMQNAELMYARDQMEGLLEKYTDLYDSAPSGHFSLDEQGRIMEVNLTGAALLGMERSRLINQRLQLFVVPSSVFVFRSFLERVFAGTGKQVCEAALMRKGAAEFWAGFQGISSISIGVSRKWCRVAFSDITSLKQAEGTKHRLEVLTASNRKLEQEIIRRKAGEASLRQSEQRKSQLLEQACQMHEQLRRLSRRILSVQEEERRRISRELHDVVAQVLTGINIRLATLKKEATSGARGLTKSISRTQRLVEKSVDIVHRFARELRPAALDDLGLIPALHTFLKCFMKDTGIRVRATAFAGVEELSNAKRTALYRVAQEALTNVTRHARASQVEVVIKRQANGVLMQIKDNGESFDVERVFHSGKTRHLGLLGMRERVEMVGGSFGVESTPGKGTTIQAQIPFGNVRARVKSR